MGDKNNDKELVRRAQKGDQNAYNLLVKKYQYKVVNLVGRFVHNPEDAQDVAQEAFIKAYRGLHSFRGDSAFYTWLYRIAVNSAKNFLLSQSRRHADKQMNVEDAEYLDETALVRDNATPDKELSSKLLEKQIYEAISKLPDDLKTAITLRELEGMSYEQIANTMECPIGTVRSRIFRARESIENHIKPLLE